MAKRRRAGAAPKSDPSAPPVLSTKPLRCPSCQGAVPLGEGDSVTCPFCSQRVEIPQEIRELRDARRRHSADRVVAEALFRKLGKPPGPLLQLWSAVVTPIASVAALVLAIAVWAGGTVAFLSLFALELVLHWLAPTLRFDFIDVYGGGGTYALFGATFAFGVLLPLGITVYLDTFADVRRALQQALAAKLPEKPGGPSQCRRCGAALDVPTDALGVQCLYCDADNLVALPPEWVARATRSALTSHDSITAAVAEEREARELGNADLLAGVVVCAIAIPVLYLAGSAAVWIDYDLSSPPSWSSANAPVRRMLAAKDTSPPIPLGVPTALSSSAQTFFVPLHHRDRLVITGPTLASGVDVRIATLTTFPLLDFRETLEWKLRGDGSYAATYDAPYTGWLLVTIELSGKSAKDPRITWRVDGAPAGEPKPPALTTRSIATLGGAANRVLFSPSGAQLAVAFEGGAAGLFDAANGALLFRLAGHAEAVKDVAYSPDGATLATASTDKTVKLWDTATGALKQTLEAHGDRAEAVAFSPDGAVLATGGRDNLVKLWDARDGFKLVRTLKGHRNTVMALAFDPSGKALASGAYDHVVSVWSVADGTELRHLTDQGTGYALSWSDDGTLLATASGAKTFSLWEGAVPKQLGSTEKFYGHEDDVYALTFAPRSTLLASGGKDRSVKLWDAATGKQLCTLSTEKTSVSSLAFSPDGRTLAATLESGVQLLELAPGASWSGR